MWCLLKCVKLAFVLQEEASYKLCKVKKTAFGKGAVPHIVVHDGRTIRYPDPDIKVRISA